jgi:hypothetical protein
VGGLLGLGVAVGWGLGLVGVALGDGVWLGDGDGAVDGSAVGVGVAERSGDADDVVVGNGNTAVGAVSHSRPSPSAAPPALSQLRLDRTRSMKALAIARRT